MPTRICYLAHATQRFFATVLQSVKQASAVTALHALFQFTSRAAGDAAKFASGSSYIC